MDRVLIELIKALQWPSRLDLERKDRGPLRRPSPYWIQKKVEEKLRPEGLIGKGRNGGVESRWKKLQSVVDVQLVINVEPFHYSRTMISWKGGLLKINEILKRLEKVDFIETLHLSLNQERSGSITPKLSTEIIHKKNAHDLSEKVELLSSLLDGFEMTDTFHGIQLFDNYDAQSYKRVMNHDSEPRTKAKRLLSSLLTDPLIKMPELAIRAELSRAETKKTFYDLIGGGFVLFEPAIDAMSLSDFTISALSIFGTEESKSDIYRKLINNTNIGERVLLTRQYYKGLLSCILWSSSYYDVINLFEELSRSGITEEISLAWQFRSIPMKNVSYPFLD